MINIVKKKNKIREDLLSKIEWATIVSFVEYPYIIFIMAKIMEMNANEQNQVALYLFNSINNDARKNINIFMKYLTIWNKCFKLYIV